MGINIGGASLNAATSGTNSTLGILFNNNVKIDHEGRTWQPGSPVMAGRRTGQNNRINEYPWAVNTLDLNNGSYWNGTTFTTPFDGLYFVSISFIMTAQATSVSSGIQSYNAIVKNGLVQTFTYTNSNNTWESVNMSCIVPCSAGDTIQYAINADPAPGTKTAGGAYADNHNLATIWLIG